MTCNKDQIMEFLVEFDVNIPDAASETEIRNRKDAEAAAAATLADQGHLLRLWKPPARRNENRASACTAPTAKQN